MFLRKFYENVSKRDEEFANSDDYFTPQSNFDDENDSSDEAFDEASDEVFDEMKIMHLMKHLMTMRLFKTYRK